MKNKFNSVEYLAKKIVCDLNCENMLLKGYELIGFLSFMIRDELIKYCEHEWKHFPNELSHFCPELSALPMPIRKICTKCGEVLNE